MLNQLIREYIETKFNTDVIGVNVTLEKQRLELVTITLIDKRTCTIYSAMYLLSFLTMLDTLSFDTIIEGLYFTLAKMGRQSS